jgi:hypothetical protein
MKRMIFAAAVSAMTVCWAPLADADAADDQFVARLNEANVPGNRNAEVAIGHESCGLTTVSRVGFVGALGVVDSPFKTLLDKIRNELLDQGVEPGTQMRAFERATNDVYCPGLNSVMNG